MSEMEQVPQVFIPFNVGDKIAFREDHPTHPGMYGLVTDIGVVNGVLNFDVDVIDPELGTVGATPNVFRAVMEDIQ